MTHIHENRLKRGVSVVIPCLNERGTLGDCLEKAQTGLNLTGLPGEIIVADNGSTDGSQRLAKQLGARLVEVEERGYGAALDKGIRSAQYEWVIFADADGSYPFEELPKLVFSLETHDFVLGNRLNPLLKEGAMPLLHRYLGTPVLSRLIYLFHGLKTSDCNSGMRALRRECYERLQLQCPGMEFASEMVIAVKKANLSYCEIPISFSKDKRNRPPHLRPWRDGWRHLRFILATSSSKTILLLPIFLATICLLSALLLSLQAQFEPLYQTRYHTAFILISVSVPLLFFAVGLLLVRVSYSEKWKLPLTDFFVQKLESNLFIICSLASVGWLLIETLFVSYRWYLSGFMALSEMASLIRMSIASLLSSVFFVLDLGMGILGLLGKKPKLKSPQSSTQMTELKPALSN